MKDSAKAERVNSTESLDNSINFNETRKSKKYCTRAITDIGVGIYWRTACNLCENELDILFKLGWEHHYFYNQGLSGASLHRTNLTSNQETFFGHQDTDLSTQGVTLSLAVGF